MMNRIPLRVHTVKRANANLSCYRWKIKNFSNITKTTGNFILSRLLTRIDSKVQWRLKLFPNGKTEKESDFMLVEIYYLSPIDVTATVELSVVNIDNDVLDAFKLKKEVKLIAHSDLTYRVRCDDYFKFARRCDIENPTNRILADSCLTISCDITFHDTKPVPMITNDVETLKNERLLTLDDFGKLLEDDKFSDVKFVVGDKEIQAHKAILASRSPVFHAMFTSDMQEKKQNIVEIVDIDYAVLVELLRFMYTGVVRDIEKVACDLLVAAEKYCVERLKALCEKTLSGNLKIDNALECLIIADNCNAFNLKKGSLEFIVKNSRSVVEREEFGLLPSELMCEVTRALSKRKTNTF